VPIGKYFLQEGRITAQQLNAALEYKQQNGCKLGQALVSLGFVTEAELIDALRQQGKVYCIYLVPEIIDLDVAAQLGERESRRLRCVAINRIARYATVAMADPNDLVAIDELSRTLKSRVFPVFAEPTKIDQALEAIFAKPIEERSEDAVAEAATAIDRLVQFARNEELQATETGLPLSGGKDVVFESSTVDEEDGGSKEYDKPVINLVRSILEEAFVLGASDIHLEPRRSDFLVRFRVDGNLFDRTTVPKAWSRPILARIKVLANLDIAQRRLPQDGRAQFNYRGQRVDLRLATTPTLHGEGAVLRILDGGKNVRDLEALDLSPEQVETLDRIITCRDGFFLTTGPTGSGKTTTLYALLARLNQRDTKVITLEDPVENEMAGIIQINANPKIGLTFAAGLRSILRQDPDVVLVGEIRDQETASIAVQASLTGHIVLSTLHTVGTAESITRLVDMGIEPYLLADTLRGIVAQRLVRRVCQSCKASVRPEGRILQRLGLADDGAQFFVGRGCGDCHDTGYKGRLGIYEIMQMTPTMNELVMRGVTTEELNKAALREGMTPLRADGLRKARAGLTTLDEVLAATTRG
jgi:type IV pilus assembly protein PilB